MSNLITRLCFLYYSYFIINIDEYNIKDDILYSNSIQDIIIEKQRILDNIKYSNSIQDIIIEKQRITDNIKDSNIVKALYLKNYIIKDDIKYSNSIQDIIIEKQRILDNIKYSNSIQDIIIEKQRINNNNQEIKESNLDTPDKIENKDNNNNNKDRIKDIIFNKARKIYKDLHLMETQMKIKIDNRQKAAILILYNNNNDKFYVGSAITNRIFTKFRNICFHGTESRIMKKAINKHGIENFYFIIYEYYPGIIHKENFKGEYIKLLLRESQIIKLFDPDYNIILNNDKDSIVRTKHIIIYHLNTGEKIKEFNSIRELSYYLESSNKSIYKTLKNNNIYQNKFIIKYLE
jgi:hypothetical protein